MRNRLWAAIWIIAILLLIWAGTTNKKAAGNGVTTGDDWSGVVDPICAFSHCDPKLVAMVHAK